MKVYLSGPMTGLPEFNFPAFHAGAAELRAAGYEVANPAEEDLNDGFNPSIDDPADLDLRAALERDIEAVLACDALVLLPGWMDSPGTAVEVLTARAMGIPVLTLDEALALAA